MPVVGHTKVLPELLAETYQRLRPQFARHAQRSSRPLSSHVVRFDVPCLLGLY
jgi:hypothetical protein